MHKRLAQGVNNQNHADVVICGAGLAGIASAFYLRRLGVNRVVVVDKLSPLSFTSAMSTECYRDHFPQPCMRGLMGRSITLLEEFAIATQNAFNMNRSGYLFVTKETQQPKESTELERHHIATGQSYSRSVGSFGQKSWLGARGVDVLHGNDTIQQHFPFLDKSISTATHARRCGYMSAQHMGLCLIDELHAMGGVEILRGEVIGVGAHQNTIHTVNVQLTDGSHQALKCGAFVNAGGPESPRVHTQVLGLSPLPLHNEVHAKAVFKDVLGVVPRDCPMLIFQDPQQLPWSQEEVELMPEIMGKDKAQRVLNTMPGGVHLRPYGADSLLLLWECWHSHLQVTHPLQMDVGPLLDHEWYTEICLRGLATVIPEFRRYFDGSSSTSRVAFVDGGYYCHTPENLPVIGPAVDTQNECNEKVYSNAFICAGLSGFGVMASHGAGELLAQWVVGQPSLPPHASELNPARYLDKEYVENLEQLMVLGKKGQI